MTSISDKMLKELEKGKKIVIISAGQSPPKITILKPDKNVVGLIKLLPPK